MLLAEELDAKVGIIIVWGQFLLSSLEATQFVDELNRQAVIWHFERATSSRPLGPNNGFVFWDREFKIGTSMNTTASGAMKRVYGRGSSRIISKATMISTLRRNRWTKSSNRGWAISEARFTHPALTMRLW